MGAISVLTLVHRRKRHLLNLLEGLKQSARLPDEVVVVYMNEPSDYALPPLPYPVRSLHVRSEDTNLPLAEARNQAAAQATSNQLIFLDVDCIPEADLLMSYERALAQFGGLLMGDVRYLPAQAAASGWTFSQLRARAVPHPARPVVSTLVQPEDRYELFWSLSFGIHRAVFERLGGFDTGYQGYGAEDTDLAFTARLQQIPFALCRARAYHQHHTVYRPPLPHLSDIIANARYFYHKWQRWPMEGWLQKFQEAGYIDRQAEGRHLKLLRLPRADEIEAARSDAPAGF
jgi:GT2 family glycosyltransferase